MKTSLTKAEIIRGKSDLKQLFSTTSVGKSGVVHIRVCNNGKSYSRIICTPTRGFKPAVARNRARRVVKEFYRQNKENIIKGIDIAFILFPCTQKTVLRSSIIALMRRVGLMVSVERGTVKGEYSF